jgi:hypothetical protein
VTEEPDYLAAALHSAVRGRCFLNDSERARFFAVARRYQTLAIAEGIDSKKFEGAPTINSDEPHWPTQARG